MTLNAIQMEFLGSFRQGQLEPEEVIAQLSNVDEVVYQNATFRELLFALDAENVLEGPEWQRILVRGLEKHSGWLAKGELKPCVFVEIGKLHETYGRGEYGLEAVVDMVSVATIKPSNAESFVRRCIREHYSGIRPMTEHGLFVVKKYIEPRVPLREEDLKMMMHVQSEIKGLECAEGFPRFWAMAVKKSITLSDDERSRTNRETVMRFLENNEEPTDAERILVEGLREQCVPLSERVLEYIDVSRFQLLGFS